MLPLVLVIVLLCGFSVVQAQFCCGAHVAAQVQLEPGCPSAQLDFTTPEKYIIRALLGLTRKKSF